MASLDRDWHIGVCGWKHEGRHLRLAELLTLVEESERQGLIDEHRNACILLALVLAKLGDELNEALDIPG